MTEVNNEIWDVKQRADMKILEKDEWRISPSRLGSLQAFLMSKKKLPNGKNKKAVQNFISKCYMLAYDSKTHQLKYNDCFDHKMCVLTNKEWGNLYSALMDVKTFEFTNTNAYAKKVLDTDTYHYIRMANAAEYVLNYLKAQHDKLTKKK